MNHQKTYLQAFRYISPNISKQERVEMNVFFAKIENIHPTTKEILSYLAISRNAW
jgi:hypothetical protein